VVPEIENAILSGHHMVFLGERGQGKSRIIRALIALLDPMLPVIAGCQINDDPLAPLCAACRRQAASAGDALGIHWLPRGQRYGEKLATPDVSMADLIGEIDPSAWPRDAIWPTRRPSTTASCRGYTAASSPSTSFRTLRRRCRSASST
jgi:Mg-chelatase subunit ChlI